MPDDLGLRHDRLTLCAAEERAAMGHFPVTSQFARQIKRPQVALNIPRVHPISNTIAIGIDDRWRRQSVAMSDRPHPRWNAEVITPFGPLTVETAIKKDDKEFGLAGSRRTGGVVFITITDNRRPTAVWK